MAAHCEVYDYTRGLLPPYDLTNHGTMVLPNIAVPCYGQYRTRYAYTRLDQSQLNDADKLVFIHQPVSSQKWHYYVSSGTLNLTSCLIHNSQILCRALRHRNKCAFVGDYVRMQQTLL